MGRMFEMPEDNSAEVSKYIGTEPEFERRSVIKTTDGQDVIVLDWLKDKGVYVVTNVDRENTASPAYRISPDKLKKGEKQPENAQ